MELIAYRDMTGKTAGCGAQVPAMEVYLTWRPTIGATDGTAVAVEVLPENFVP